MNKNEALIRLSDIEKEADELKKIIDDPDKIDEPDEIDPEKYLLDILSKCTGKVEDGGITWSIGDQWIWQQDFKNDTLWCYHHGVWRVFGTKYGMTYEQTQALHKKAVCKALNCEGLTPKRRRL